MGSHINIYICFPQSPTSFRVRGRLGNNFKVYVKIKHLEIAWSYDKGFENRKTHFIMREYISQVIVMQGGRAEEPTVRGSPERCTLL